MGLACLRGSDVSDELRTEFYRLLTQDGETADARRRGYNQAIFLPEEQGGSAVFNGTNVYMVMEKFDRAVRNMQRRSE